MVKLTDKRGFTLIEVIVSIAMLSIITVPALGIIEAVIINNKNSGVNIQSASKAQSIMDWYKAIGPYNIKKTVRYINTTSNTVSIYYFLKETDIPNLTDILKNNRWNTAATGTGVNDYDGIKTLSSSLPDGFDIAVKVVLDIGEYNPYNGNVTKISVTLWNNKVNPNNKVHLVSAKGE